MNDVRPQTNGLQAATEMMPLVYDELRRLAVRYMRAERTGHTLQATSLVNEAYVRMARGGSGPWRDQEHFFAAAATLVRRILLQHARARNTRKRGAGMDRVEVDLQQIPQNRSDSQLLAVDDALRQLDAVDHDKARLVEMRFFGGLSNDQAAEALGISPRSAAREWAMAKAWLNRKLSELESDER